MPLIAKGRHRTGGLLHSDHEVVVNAALWREPQVQHSTPLQGPGSFASILDDCYHDATITRSSALPDEHCAGHLHGPELSMLHRNVGRDGDPGTV